MTTDALFPTPRTFADVAGTWLSFSSSPGVRHLAPSFGPWVRRDGDVRFWLLECGRSVADGDEIRWRQTDPVAGSRPCSFCVSSVRWSVEFLLDVLFDADPARAVEIASRADGRLGALTDENVSAIDRAVDALLGLQIERLQAVAEIGGSGYAKGGASS